MALIFNVLSLSLTHSLSVFFCFEKAQAPHIDFYKLHQIYQTLEFPFENELYTHNRVGFE